MKLRSFEAATMQEAMARVRDALGDEAIIIDTEQTDEGFFITAAVDNAPAVIAEQEDESESFEERIALKPRKKEATDLIMEALWRHGVPSELTDRLLAYATQSTDTDPVAILADALSDLLLFAPVEMATQEKPILLVGPVGAGKTLTTAKLATNALQAGRAPVAITTDTLRAGGVEQLESLTSVMQTPLHTCEDPAAVGGLLKHLRGQSPHAPVVVDTAGCNPYDTADISTINKLIKVAEFDSILVMGAGGDPAEIAEITDIFRKAGAKRLIMTRFDTCKRLGSLLVAAWRGGLAIANAGRSLQIVGGLPTLTPHTLAAVLLASDTQDLAARFDAFHDQQKEQVS